MGGHALAFHGWPRFTKDIDFWVRPTQGNAARILAALFDFGFEDVGLASEDFCAPGRVIQLGLPPNRIDLVTSIDGVEFDAAFARKIESEYQGTPLLVIHRDDLIANKRAAGREQDLIDVRILTSRDDPS
ncbi:MAG: hypothetical protein PHU25_04165 [Deltaproteobacteria bacterium]|nr:hypothetical protein [Deltaproteobacteria bacterium]